ncbi:MAG: diguanylate cyclase, partial [Microcoleaceae cyanobacterium]
QENDSLFYRPPVLMITALEDKASIDLAFAVGAIDYITKPIQWAVLSQRVQRILQINKLVKELREQTERWQLMTLIQERIGSSLNLNDILETTVEQVRKFLKTDRVLIYKFKPDGRGEIIMESVDCAWKSVMSRVGMDRPLSTKYIEQYSQDELPIQENIDAPDLTPYHIKFLTRFQVKANLVIPISKTNTEQSLDSENSELDYPREQLWGLLIAHHCSELRQWQSSEIEFIEHLAGQLAIAIQQSELYQKLETANKKLIQLATYDSLTNVANRRLFDEYLEREWRRMAREKTPISLILCDVDYFKFYNDTYGHQAGDRCLQKVANAIKLQVKRPADLVARYGGEEFVVVLPCTDARGAFHVAEQIHLRLQTLKLVNAGSKVSEFVTMSLGVATTIPIPGYSLDKLIKVADEALYQAKEEGRNSTIIKIF